MCCQSINHLDEVSMVSLENLFLDFVQNMIYHSQSFFLNETKQKSSFNMPYILKKGKHVLTVEKLMFYLYCKRLKLYIL